MGLSITTFAQLTLCQAIDSTLDPARQGRSLRKPSVATAFRQARSRCRNSAQTDWPVGPTAFAVPFLGRDRMAALRRRPGRLGDERLGLVSLRASFLEQSWVERLRIARLLQRMPTAHRDRWTELLDHAETRHHAAVLGKPMRAQRRRSVGQAESSPPVWPRSSF